MESAATEYHEKIESLESIGKRLYFLRRACNITRKILSQKSGIPERTIKSWERDEKTPRPTNLLSLLNIYEILGVKSNINWVLGTNLYLIPNDENLLELSGDPCLIANHLIYDKETFEKAYKKTETENKASVNEDLKSFLRKLVKNYHSIQNK